MNTIDTGAFGAIPRDDIDRMDKHAELFYESIRNRKSNSDVLAISNNTGYSFEDILKVKEHLFLNTYDLGRAKPVRFDPLYDIAQSWQRLINGGSEIRNMDWVLLKNELFEYELKQEKNMPYLEAHKIAEKEYDYSRFVIELNLKEGVN
jgi:hypothetical protein